MRRVSSLTALGLVLITGCSPFGAALKQAKNILPPGGDVAFAVVSDDGRVYPKTLIVQKGVHAIVWVADSDKLTITFAQTPPPVTVTCAGPVCWAATPPAADSGRPGYLYEGTVGSGSKAKPLDPRVEVVP